MRALKKGFTLIEILIVIVILGFLFAILITSFRDVQVRQALEFSTRETRQMIELARSRTLAALNDNRHGVFIGTTRVVLFEGSTYNEHAATNVVFELDPRVRISNVSLTPPANTIVFTRGTGEPSSSGTIELSLIADPMSRMTITITNTGIVRSL